MNRSTPSPGRGMPGARVVIAFLIAVVLLALGFYFVMWRLTAGFRRSPPLVAVARPGQDSAVLARRLGVAVFPGARSEPTIEDTALGTAVLELRFQSSAPSAAVMEFYHEHYPDADLEDEDGESWLLQWEGKDHFGIHALTEAGRTTIEIALLKSGS